MCTRYADAAKDGPPPTLDWSAAALKKRTQCKPDGGFKNGPDAWCGTPRPMGRCGPDRLMPMPLYMRLNDRDVMWTDDGSSLQRLSVSSIHPNPSSCPALLNLIELVGLPT